jgi:hypothetical protein
MYEHIGIAMTKNPERFYVYAYLRNKDSDHGRKNTPYYIGKGCRDRATSKVRTIPKPSDAAYIVYVQEGLTEPDAFRLEQYCISLYGRIDNGTGILRNLSDGGDGPAGTIPSMETRQKIAAAGRNRKQSADTRLKISEAQLGAKNHQWGKSMPVETRRKISEANRGLKRSEETRRKIAAGKCKYSCVLMDPDGNTYDMCNLYQFASQHGLHRRLLRDLVIGHRSDYKGWTVVPMELHHL